MRPINLSNFFFNDSRQIKTGMYFYQIKAWSKLFGENRLLVLKSEDFFKNPKTIVDQIQDFVGLPKYNFTDKDLRRYGSSEGCEKFLGVRQSLSPQLREQGIRIFQEDVQKLEKFLHYKFNWF